MWTRVKAGLGLAAPRPVGKPGARAYAVGDVHGCLTQLDHMLAAIEADIAAHPAEATYIVMLGDLIDRGPDSRGVIERLLHYRHPAAELVLLAGNHEEFLLRIMAGTPDLLHRWLDFGGSEFVSSYGERPERLFAMEDLEAAAAIRRIVPERHRAFVEGFGDSFRFGDYLFVHAGIRPGVPLQRQTANDLRWIREPFLSDRHDHGFVVIHGHTIAEKIVERANRIGIDTGAYRTGVLTAAVIDGEERRFIQVDAQGPVTS